MEASAVPYDVSVPSDSTCFYTDELPIPEKTIRAIDQMITPVYEVGVAILVVAQLLVVLLGLLAFVRGALPLAPLLAVISVMFMSLASFFGWLQFMKSFPGVGTLWALMFTIGIFSVAWITLVRRSFPQVKNLNDRRESATRKWAIQQIRAMSKKK